MSDTPRTDAVAKRYESNEIGAAEVLSYTGQLERENAALRADRDRLDWLLTYEGRTWFFRKLDSGEWIKSIGDVRGFIDSAMGVK